MRYANGNTRFPTEWCQEQSSPCIPPPPPPFYHVAASNFNSACSIQSYWIPCWSKSNSWIYFISTVKPAHAVTCIKRSPFSYPVIENFIWIEPLLRGHLFFVPKMTSWYRFQHAHSHTAVRVSRRIKIMHVKNPLWTL